MGFKSLRGLDIQLAPVVVVFGPNAVGKSNLLEAVVLLSRLVTERTVAEAFAVPLRGYPMECFTLPSGGIGELLSQPRASLRVEADLQLTAGENGKGDTLRYAVTVDASPATGKLAVGDEYLVRLKLDGTERHKPRIEKAGDHLVVRRLGEAGQPRQEPLGLNHTLASNLQFSGETRYPDFDHLRGEVQAWRSYYLDPGTAMRSAQPPRDVVDIGARGELLAPFLYRLRGDEQTARNFSAVHRALRTAIPSIEHLDVDLDKERGTLDIRIRQNGTEYSSRVISEGTLRVLALCAIAANPWRSSLVAFEEPENGVHPARIEVIADLLLSLGSETQLLVTSHSPTLVAAMLRRHRERPGNVALMRCIQRDGSTTLEPFPDPLPLFQDQQIKESLKGTEDEQVVHGLLARGWLDG
jgi:predicted ATPase